MEEKTGKAAKLIWLTLASVFSISLILLVSAVVFSIAAVFQASEKLENISEITIPEPEKEKSSYIYSLNSLTGEYDIIYKATPYTGNVCIETDIDTLPDGYDTMLSDSLNLSEGQKQQMTIARAMIKEAPLLILDEATSSVDTRTELVIQKAMDNLTEGKTSFVIAHRLSTVRNADVIMVMENGRIIERGNHEQLIAEKGRYYQLYNGAFELE